MKKKILGLALGAICLFGLAGCENPPDVAVKQSTKESNFVIIEDTECWKVVYHKETKVMYVVSDYSYSRGIFTLLVDANGDPMLWEEKGE